MSKNGRLKEDILELMSKPDKGKYGKYNRNIVQKYYSIEKMVNDCEKAYKMALDKHAN